MFWPLPGWQIRELLRLASGEYTALPSTVPTRVQDFVHVCLSNPKLIAYTQSAAKGERDIQTPCKLGRYLTRTFPEMSAKEVEAHVATYNAQYAPSVVHFAESADEIERVYENGPKSCMNKTPQVTRSARAYAGPDLSVAYIVGDDGDPSARAVVWQAKRIYSRIYGDAGRLEPALEALGFQKGGDSEWWGARLTVLHDARGKVMCPYLDIADTVSQGSEYLIVGGDDFNARGTSGLLEDRPNCVVCGEACNEDDCVTSEDGSYCGTCYSEKFVNCAECGRVCWREDARHTSDGTYYCDRHADNLLSNCDDCGDDTDIADIEKGLCPWCHEQAGKCEVCSAPLCTLSGGCDACLRALCLRCGERFCGGHGEIARYQSPERLGRAPLEWLGCAPTLTDASLERENSWVARPGEILGCQGGDRWYAARVAASDWYGNVRSMVSTQFGFYRAPLGRAIRVAGVRATRLDMASALAALESGPQEFADAMGITDLLRPFLIDVPAPNGALSA